MAVSSRPLCTRCHNQPSAFKIRNVAFCAECLCKIVELRPKTAFDLARGAATGYWASEMARTKGKEPESILPTITIAFSGGLASRIMLRLAIRHFCYGVQVGNEFESSTIQTQPEAAEEELEGEHESDSKKKTKKKNLRENGSKRPKEPRLAKIVVACVDESSVIPGSTSSLSAMHSALLSELYNPLNIYSTMEAHLRPTIQFVPLKLEDSFLKDDDLNKQMKGWKVGMDDEEEVFEWDQIEKEMIGLRKGTSAELVQCGAEHSTPRHLLSELSASSSGISSLLSLFHKISGSQTSDLPTAPPLSPSPSALTRLSTLLPLLTSHLLQLISHAHSSTCLLLGSSSTRSAIEFFSRVSSGGGGQWSVVGRKEGWRNGILVLYPFRDSIDKELTYYAQLNEIEGCLKTDLSATYSVGDEKAKGRDEKRSIQRLTESFILSLEAGVPSTVSTISRTGSKLVAGDFWSDSPTSKPTPTSKPISKASSQFLKTVGNRLQQSVRTAYALPVWDGDHSCPLCDGPAEKGAHGWKERRSILTRKDLKKDADAEVKLVTRKEEATTDEINLSELLCYSCILVLDVPEPSNPSSTGGAQSLMPLPPYVLSAAKKRLEEATLDTKALSNGVDEIELSSEEAASAYQNGSWEATGEGLDEASDSISKPRATGREKRSAPRKVEQSEMRNQVGEYLLEGDEVEKAEEAPVEASGIEKRIREQMKGNKLMGFRKKGEGESNEGNQPRGVDKLGEW